jgi:cytochrome c5
MLTSIGCSAGKEDAAPPVETPAPSEEPGSGDSGDNAAGEDAVAGACTGCHDMTRIYLQPEMTDWYGIIIQMEDAHGAELTDQEKADIEAFLASRQPTVAEQLIRGKCTTCHDTDGIYDQGDDVDWDAVLQEMVETHGAVLTPQEQADIAAYLKRL